MFRGSLVWIAVIAWTSRLGRVCKIGIRIQVSFWSRKTAFVVVVSFSHQVKCHLYAISAFLDSCSLFSRREIVNNITFCLGGPLLNSIPRVKSLRRL